MGAAQWVPITRIGAAAHSANSRARVTAAALGSLSNAGYQSPAFGRVSQEPLSAGYWSPGQASPGQLALISPTLGREYSGRPDYAPAAIGYAVAEQLLVDGQAAGVGVRAGRHWRNAIQ